MVKGCHPVRSYNSPDVKTSPFQIFRQSSILIDILD